MPPVTAPSRAPGDAVDSTPVPHAPGEDRELSSTAEAPSRASGSWFRDRPLVVKMLVAPALVGLALVVVGVVAAVRMQALAADADTLYADNVISTEHLAEANAAFLQMRTAVLYHILHEDPDAMLGDEQAIAEAADRIAAAVSSLTSGTLGPQERQHLEDFQANVNAYVAGLEDELLPLSRDGDVAGALAVAPKYAGFYADAATSITALIDAEHEGAGETSQQASDRDRPGHARRR